MSRHTLFRTVREKFILTCSCWVAALCASSATATIITWDPQGTSGSNPYTGSMNGTWENSSWSTSTSGQSTPTTWTEGAAAFFAARVGSSTPAFTVTMNSTHTVAGIFDGTLGADQPCFVTITGSGSITLPAGTQQGFDIATDSMTIGVPMTGTAQIVPEGTGQIYLNAANTFSGGTSIGYSSGTGFTGTIYFNNNSAFGSGAITMPNATGPTLAAEGTSAYTISNTVDLANITLNISNSAGGITFSGPWDTGATGPCTLVLGGAAGSIVTLAGTLSDTQGFTQSGGILVLIGTNNSYGSSGNTTISSGTLVLANTNGSATGVSKIVVGASGTLTGSGSATGAVNLAGALSATNLSGGTATLTTGSQYWSNNAVFQWAINNPYGNPGSNSGWDEIVINGALTNVASSTYPAVINIISLNAANQQGALQGFTNSQDYSWLVVHSTNNSSTPIAGFSSTTLTAGSSAFVNALGSGVFTISTNNTSTGGDLFVNFVHVPVLSLTNNVTTNANSNAVFSVINTVSNSTPATATYTWRSNNVTLSNGSRIFGATTPNLTIANVQTTDDATYSVTAANKAGSAVASSTLTVTAGTTSLTWSNPPAITYGTPLDTNQLNAVANVAGSYAYTPASGAILNMGNDTLSVIFTPSNTSLYTSATNTVSLSVLPAPLTVAGSNFARPYNTANPTFTGSITGLQNNDNITATYSTTATTGSPAGSYAIVPTLVDPNQRLTNYSVTISNGTLDIGSIITWAPAPITYGTALSSNQLDATADVPGNFVYTPANGTILNAGTNLLSATFTPTQSGTYNNTNATVSLVVSPAPLTATAANSSRQAGQANPVFTGTLTGVTNGDNITANYGTSATSASPAGTYSIVPMLVDPNNRQTNYAVNFVDGTLTVTAAAPPVTVSAPQIIPLPVVQSNLPGIFVLCPSQGGSPAPAHALMQILVDGASQQTGRYLAAALYKSTGYQFEISTNTATSAVRNAILITTSNAISSLGAEGYELTVAPDSAVIRAPAQGGAFYGVQSLLQLLPAQIYSPHYVTNVAWVAPCVYIKDYPLYPWRGVMLDVARHFFTADQVKVLIDGMALHKLNTLHLHLSDDQGWRLEINGYPALTANPTAGVAAGAWRNGIDYGLSPRASKTYDPSSGQYGGYYTQNDARDMVAYAAARHITIMPEFELPLHTSCVLAAYPQFSCGHPASDYPFDYPSPGINYNADVYSPGTAATMTFFTNVLTQLMSIFPGQYFHCGGDELITIGSGKFTSPENDNDWNTYPADTNNMIANGITPGVYINNNMLPEYSSCAQFTGNSPTYPTANSCCGDISIVQYQHWLSTTLANFIHGNGRTMMGWTEYEYGGQIPNAGITDWEPYGAGAYATKTAESGLPALVMPGSYCYFNYVEGSSSSLSVEPPFVVGGSPSYLPLSQVYSFNPMPCGLTGSAASNILGSECILFTEYVPSFRNVMLKLFPRAAAMAEVLWTPVGQQSYSTFTSRLPTEEQRYGQMGLNYDHETIPQIGTWGPTVAASQSTLFLNITPNVTAAGEIDVNFWETGGTGSLAISSVALLVNGVQVDIDTHAGVAGPASGYTSAPFIPLHTVYVLNLPELVPGAQYEIQAVVQSSGGTSTSGTIYMPNWN